MVKKFIVVAVGPILSLPLFGADKVAKRLADSTAADLRTTRIAVTWRRRRRFRGRSFRHRTQFVASD